MIPWQLPAANVRGGVSHTDIPQATGTIVAVVAVEVKTVKG